jgi:hypothetical protein
LHRFLSRINLEKDTAEYGLEWQQDLDGNSFMIVIWISPCGELGETGDALIIILKTWRKEDRA